MMNYFKNHTPLLVGMTLGVLLLAGAGYGWAAQKNDWWPFAANEALTKESDSSLYPSDKSVKQPQDGSQTTNNQGADPDTPTSSTPVPTKGGQQFEGNSSQSSSIKASISSVSQSNDYLRVRVNIETVGTNGQCHLTLTRNGQEVTDSVGIQALAQSSTCQGFDIPLQKLSKGTWQLKLEVSAGGSRTSMSQSVTIQ